MREYELFLKISLKMKFCYSGIPSNKELRHKNATSDKSSNNKYPILLKIKTKQGATLAIESNATFINILKISFIKKKKK